MESTDPTYREMSMPPQEPSTAFVCSDCSAHVSDPHKHTLAVHRGSAGVEVSPGDRSGDPRQAGPRQ